MNSILKTNTNPLESGIVGFWESTQTNNSPAKTFLGSNYLEYFIFIFIGLILFFLLVRELITWYWKINKIVRLLEKIERNTNPEITKEKSKDI